MNGTSNQLVLPADGDILHWEPYHRGTSKCGIAFPRRLCKFILIVWRACRVIRVCWKNGKNVIFTSVTVGWHSILTIFQFVLLLGVDAVTDNFIFNGHIIIILKPNSTMFDPIMDRDENVARHSWYMLYGDIYILYYSAYRISCVIVILFL